MGSETSTWGTEASPGSGSLFSLLRVTRLDCSTAALTHRGRTCVSPPRACLLCSPGSPTRPEPGVQELTLFQDYFSLHPAFAADDYQHLHDLCCCRRARCQSHSPTNHSQSISLQKEQRQVTESIPGPPAVCATDAPCLLLRQTVIQHDSVGSRATATEKGCNENLRI